MKKIKKIYYLLDEWHTEFIYAKANNSRIKLMRSLLCDIGLHWPIVWDENAYPGYSEDLPEPPSPDFCCGYCGEIKEPYRAVFWRIKEKIYGN